MAAHVEGGHLDVLEAALAGASNPTRMAKMAGRTNSSGDWCRGSRLNRRGVMKANSHRRARSLSCFTERAAPAGPARALAWGRRRGRRFVESRSFHRPAAQWVEYK